MNKFYCTPSPCGPVSLFIFKDKEEEKTLQAFRSWVNWNKFLEELPVLAEEKQIQTIVFPNNEFCKGLSQEINFMGVELL